MVFAECRIITGSLWGFRLGILETKLNLSPFFSFSVYLSGLRVFHFLQMDPLTTGCKRYSYMVQLQMGGKSVFNVLVYLVFYMYISINY